MGLTELQGKYKRLRRELEDAYAAPAWNRPRIDRITDELTETELALAAAYPTEADTSQSVLEFGR